MSCARKLTVSHPDAPPAAPFRSAPSPSALSDSPLRSLVTPRQEDADEPISEGSGDPDRLQEITETSKSSVFTALLFAQILVYAEAGAIPALLDRVKGEKRPAPAVELRLGFEAVDHDQATHVLCPQPIAWVRRRRTG